MKNLSEIIHDLDMVTKQYVDDVAEAKVDKVDGKQLSTNDFTTEEKEKLAGLSITQYSTLPTANMRAYKDIVQYVGNTTEEYITGYFYQCQKAEVGYEWVAIDVQDIDWSNLNNYSTNMVVAKATTDDAETGIYNIKIKSLPTAYAYGGLPLDIIYDENGEAPANIFKLFAGNVVATANMKAADRTALFSGTNFYVTYNGVKKKIEVPKTDSTPTNAQLGYILQDLISNAFGSNILKVGPSGMKIAFSLNDFGGGTNWTDGAPTIIIEDGDENNALIPLHIDNGSVLGFNINLPLNQLLDASVFVDGVYTLNLRSGVAANGTIFWQSESFNFLETDTIGKVFETINNSKLTIHIYYDAINNRIMIESTVGGPNGVFDWGEDWTLWNALNITETLRTDIDQYIADGGYISTGANGYFDLTSPSGQVFTDVILTTKQCYFRGIEFNFANANPNESYLIAVTTQKSEGGTYTTLENKPTLNGVEIDGDKTTLDYGINDTNVYYGTEEPTAENVVMWVDPSGSDAITGDELDKIKGDLYTQDRCNLLRITSEETKKVDINGFVQKSSVGNTINAIATNGEGLYVAVGPKGYIATSTDLINWTKQTSGTTLAFYDVAYGNGVFIAVGQNQCVYKSANGGVTWVSKLNAGSSYTLYSVAYGNGGFIASGDAQNVLSENNSFYSIDNGETWVARDVGQKNYRAYTNFTNNQFVTISMYNGGTVYTSSTADSSLTTKATNVTAFNSYYMYKIIYANGYYIAGGYQALAISKDLVTWTQISTDRVNALIENNGQIIIGFDSGYLKATENFEHIQQSSSTYGVAIDFLKEGDKIISFSSNGNIFESTTYLSEYKQHLDMPLTSYEKGKIINVEGGKYENVTSFYKPMLNINNLGEKQINSTIDYGEKYSLVYNGESWDILGAKFAYGEVAISSTGNRSVDFGFDAKAVFAYCSQTSQRSNDMYSMGFIPMRLNEKIILEAHANAPIMIYGTLVSANQLQINVDSFAKYPCTVTYFAVTW